MAVDNSQQSLHAAIRTDDGRRGLSLPR